VPTYQYACKEPACGHRFEVVQSFTDGPLAACPVCEGQVRKVFSAVGVVFKGSGFYRNDSREPAKSSSSNGSSSSSRDNGSAEKKSESSPSSSSSDSSGSGSSSGSPSKAPASSGSSPGSTSNAAAS
jgi:putative FmdB family regulatory protein